MLFNNPTFKPGDAPGHNLLANTAPQPQACDKEGATQCETGSSTSTGGTGGTGTGAGTGGTDSGSGSGGSTYVGPTGNGKANLEAYAYEPPKPVWGLSQTFMVIAGLLAIILVIAPPFVLRRLEKRKSGE